MKTITQTDLVRISDTLWEIPVSSRAGMRVPVYIYASDSLIVEMLRDKTINQIMNVATLPGIKKAAMVMPDGHEGYGFPIGGVAAFDMDEGVISPGGIGYDINCGVRLLTSGLTYDEARPLIPRLTHELTRSIPKGVGRGGAIELKREELDRVLVRGVHWAAEQGYAFQEDLNFIESGGKLPDADPAMVSQHAAARGSDQLGTLGGGNHFVEVDYIEEIFDSDKAEIFGLFPGQMVILIHTGSRGLGHQVATDYLRLFITRLPEYGFHLPDLELACAPVASPEGKCYVKAMAAAANFAWCNRQVISHKTRSAWKYVTGRPERDLKLLYDVAHNIAKIETHQTDGESKKVIVHRKGATRAFGPGHPEIPEAYRAAGQPVLIPGSMGTCSYILSGSSSEENRAFGSCCHGAGRRLSRRAAKQNVNAPNLKKELEMQGISVEAESYAGLAEEAPLAYKAVDEVVDTVHRAKLAYKTARLRPVGVIKG